MPTLNEKTLEDDEKETQDVNLKPNVVFAINSLDEIPPATSAVTTPASLKTIEKNAAQPLNDPKNFYAPESDVQ